MAAKKASKQQLGYVDGQKAKWYVVGGIISITAIGLGVYAIGKKIRRSRVNNIEKNVLYEGTEENFAKQLKIALDAWIFADSESVLKVFEQINSKEQYEKVAKYYQTLTGKILTEDLEKKLSKSDFNTIIAIIGNRKESDKAQLIVDNSSQFAAELKDAIYGYGADTDKIFQIARAIPNRVVLEKTLQAYKSLTGNELLDDLKGELEMYDLYEFFGWDTNLDKFNQIISSKK